MKESRPVYETEHKKVGILMPVYNLGQYIDEAIKSLDKQTFRDFHLVIVDDASTDEDTVAKLRTLAERLNACVLFEKKNMGLGALASKYLPKINAEYLIIISPDDIVEPTYLEEVVAYLDTHDDVAAASSHLSMFGERTGLVNPKPMQYSLPAMLIENSFVGSALMRRSALDSIGWMSSSRNHEDYLLWLSALEKGLKLHLVPKPLFRYRIRSNSMSIAFHGKRIAILRKNWSIYTLHSTKIMHPMS